MKLPYLPCLIILFPAIIHAQDKLQKHIRACDCKNAVEITDTIYADAPASTGPGLIMEIKTSNFHDPLSFHKEHHTTWYKFRAPYNADLEFEIIPDQVKDDYDFMLFSDSGSSVCDAIRDKKINPVRTCISRNDTSIGSITGISISSTRPYIPSGKGESFSSSLTVQKEKWYYLVVDNVYEGGKGHSIRLHYRNVKATTAKPVSPLFKIPEAGKSISFDQVQFVANMDLFLPVSKPYLDTLLQLMNEFPTLKIRIEGHVNGPGSENTPYYQDLSERRAKAVYNFLIEKGIVEERLKWAGYGNTRMQYINPSSERQAQMNRRVEVRILEK